METPLTTQQTQVPEPKTSTPATRPPLPPFTRETAIQKVRLAEDGWNSRDPEKVALAYTIDSRWRNRAEFPNGRQEIIQFLTRKWAKELDYRLIKELWAFNGNRIAVRFAYEWHDDSGHWFRSYGNENWEFDEHGLMRRGLRQSTISQSRNRIANTTGRSGDVLMTIRIERLWASSSLNILKTTWGNSIFYRFLAAKLFSALRDLPDPIPENIAPALRIAPVPRSKMGKMDASRRALATHRRNLRGSASVTCEMASVMSPVR